MATTAQTKIGHMMGPPFKKNATTTFAIIILFLQVRVHCN
jgi:hypothetical protein